MSPTATQPGTIFGPRLRIPFERSWLVVAALAILLTIIVMPALRVGEFVDAVRVVNPGEFNVTVDVASSPNDGWMRVGTAINRHTLTTQEVYDIGATWYFRFSTPYGETQVRMTRSDLERRNWSARVPDAFTEELHHAGAVPSPEFQ